MDIADLITPAAVIHGLRAADKRMVLQRMAERLATLTGIPGDDIVEAMQQREQLGSTGFGGGTAIPHAKLTAVTAPIAVLARLDTPVDFDALDAAPVDVVVMLLAPAAAGADHLKALACLSRALRDARLVAKLRGAASSDAIYALLAGGPQSRAA